MLRGTRCGPGSSWKRHDDRREDAGEALRREPNDGPEVAHAVEHDRCPDGTEGGPLDRADAGGGSDHRGLAAAYPAAAGRLPLRPAAHNPAPHPVIAAPVPRTAWH